MNLSDLQNTCKYSFLNQAENFQANFPAFFKTSWTLSNALLNSTELVEVSSKSTKLLENFFN